MKIVIDYKKCVLCKECINSCPLNLIKLRGKKIKIDQDRCILCRMCLINCPINAISFK